MGHVDHQVGADFVRDLAEPGPVPDPAVGGAAGQDKLGLVLQRLGADLVEIQHLVLLAHAIGDGVEPLARHVHGRAVGQVTAGIQVETQEGVAGLQQGQEHGLVHLAAGIGLHVGKVRAEQFLRALDRQRFGDVDELAAAVIAFAGITFGILVRHDRTLRFKHGGADDVFRGDQFDLFALTAKFGRDGAEDLGIAGGQGFAEETAVAVRGVHGLFPFCAYMAPT